LLTGVRSIATIPLFPPKQFFAKTLHDNLTVAYLLSIHFALESCMRWNLSQVIKVWGYVRLICKYGVSSLLALSALMLPPLIAQSPPQQFVQPSNPTSNSGLPDRYGKSVHQYTNQLADLSRAGNIDATRELTRQVFRNSGLASEMADSFGFTNRIVQAESAYQSGTQPPIHEADIAKAVNNFAKAVAAPKWVSTNEAEVRKLRMRMLVSYPRLIASREPPDSKGRYKALSDNMRPVEAVDIAITLLYQKHYNADFQFTTAEQAQNAKIDAATETAMHLERIQTFDHMLSGPSSQVSVRDLQSLANGFFDDLGIAPAAGSADVESPTSTPGTTQKGVQR
jgi:hypothetical protein